MPGKEKVIDITVPISPLTPVFPGDPEPSIERTCTLEKEGYEVSRLSFGSHTGTHVDAPAHLLKAGLPVDKLELERLMGSAFVFDFSSIKGALTGDILEEVFQGGKVSRSVSIILLKTRSSSGKENDSKASGPKDEKIQDREPGEGRWLEEPAYLDESAAAWIVGKGFKTVGIDSFSVDSLHSESLPAHHILLSNNINIVECLDLNSVETGTYFFMCLPLKIEGCDGAPARALLISGS